VLEFFRIITSNALLSQEESLNIPKEFLLQHSYNKVKDIFIGGAMGSIFMWK
jgi:hypothetical protein